MGRFPAAGRRGGANGTVGSAAELLSLADVFEHHQYVGYSGKQLYRV